MYRPPASAANIAKPASMLPKIREDGWWTGVVGLAVELCGLVGIIGLHPFRWILANLGKDRPCGIGL